MFDGPSSAGRPKRPLARRSVSGRSPHTISSPSVFDGSERPLPCLVNSHTRAVAAVKLFSRICPVKKCWRLPSNSKLVVGMQVPEHLKDFVLTSHTFLISVSCSLCLSRMISKTIRSRSFNEISSGLNVALHVNSNDSQTSPAAIQTEDRGSAYRFRGVCRACAIRAHRSFG